MIYINKDEIAYAYINQGPVKREFFLIVVMKQKEFIPQTEVKVGRYKNIQFDFLLFDEHCGKNCLNMIHMDKSFDTTR